MEALFKFMFDCPFTTFILIVAIYCMFKLVVFVLPNRLMRHWNIRKHGYPPAHCDADGDFKDTDM